MRLSSSESGPESAEHSATLTSASVVARSAVWRFFEVAGSEGLAFVFMVLLARVLGPNDYGIVAMAALFVASCQRILYSGIPDALVQGDDVSNLRLDSAFWVNVLIGLALTVLFIAGGALAADIVGEPPLEDVLAGLSPLPMLFAANGVFQARLRRAMKFRVLALRTHTCVLAGGITGAILAFSGAGYWSLVAQQLASAITNLIILAIDSDWRPRLRVDSKQVRSLYRFGGHVSSRALIDTLSQSGLAFIVGIFLPTTEVGLFAVARRVLLSLSYFTIGSILEIMLPVLSRMSASPDQHREAVYKTFRFATLLCVPSSLIAAAVAEPMLRSVFGDRWAGSATCLQIMLVGGIFQAFCAIAVQVFSSIGQPKHGLYLSILGSIIPVILVLVLARNGINAAAMGLAIGSAAAYPFALLYLRKILWIKPTRVLREQLPICAGAAIIAVVIYLLIR